MPNYSFLDQKVGETAINLYHHTEEDYKILRTFNRTTGDTCLIPLDNDLIDDLIIALVQLRRSSYK